MLRKGELEPPANRKIGSISSDDPESLSKLFVEMGV